MSNKANLTSSLKLELCTYNEADWKSFMQICATAFQNSSPFRRSHPDPHKRRLFLPEYFKYIYETELSNGRAGLACVKKFSPDHEPQIIYGFCLIFDTCNRVEKDKTSMGNIDKLGMEVCLKEDEWLENKIRSRIRKLSKSMNFAAIYAYWQASVQGYMNNGIGSKYITPSCEMLVEDGKKRGLIPRHLPTVVYGVLDDVRARRFHRQTGSTEIAHMHFEADGKRQIRCVDFSCAAKEDEIFDCVIVVAKVLGNLSFSLENLRTVFNTSSKL